MKSGMFAQSIAAPMFTLDCELIGPDADDQKEYLCLLEEAARADEEQCFERAQVIRDEARQLLHSQWREVTHNLVMSAGKSDVINQYFKGSAYNATWYMGLLGSGTISVSDIMSAHSGWNELTPYNGNRPTITWGTTLSGSNTANQVSFAINANASIAGAFIANNSTAGGTRGTLYSAANFSALCSVSVGDTLNITPTVAFL